MELLPCPFCGQTPWVEYGTDVSYGIRVEHLCRTTPCETEADAAAEWNAANAPADPALLALAKLGAMVLDWSPLECGFPAMPGSVIDTMAVKSGCSLEDSGDGGHACWIAPNVRLAIAALLAPDGAASEGVTDGD